MTDPPPRASGASRHRRADVQQPVLAGPVPPHARERQPRVPRVDRRPAEGVVGAARVRLYEGAPPLAAGISCNDRDSPYKGERGGRTTEGPRRVRRAWGICPIVTSQYSSTTSYHIS
jgi:hypothetical protein